MAMVLTGEDLTTAKVLRVARNREEIVLSPEGLERAAHCREFLERSIAAGEKMYEEFYTAEDVVDLDTYQRVGVVHEPPLDAASVGQLNKTVSELTQMRKSGSWSTDEIVSSVESVVSGLEHKHSDLNLDQKM